VGAAWYRASAVLRRRWRASIVLVALVGVSGGVVLTAVAGARRSSTAYERFRQETDRAGIRPALLARLSGFNFNGGRRLEIGAYAVRP